jgi:hypothetical protein
MGETKGTAVVSDARMADTYLLLFLVFGGIAAYRTAGLNVLFVFLALNCLLTAICAVRRCEERKK